MMVENCQLVHEVEVGLLLWLVMEKWMVVEQLLWEQVAVWWMALVEVGL